MNVLKYDYFNSFVYVVLVSLGKGTLAPPMGWWPVLLEAVPPQPPVTPIHFSTGARWITWWSMGERRRVLLWGGGGLAKGSESPQRLFTNRLEPWLGYEPIRRSPGCTMNQSAGALAGYEPMSRSPGCGAAWREGLSPQVSRLHEPTNLLCSV